MRRINGFDVIDTADGEGDNCRPALRVQIPGRDIVALFAVSYDDRPMSEEQARDEARAVLDLVVSVSADGRAIFLGDGDIRVRLIFPRRE